MSELLEHETTAAVPTHIPEPHYEDLAMTKCVRDLLLIVFIHGFKGTDETFGGFPERLQHVLTETISHVSVECTVFPAYEV